MRKFNLWLILALLFGIGWSSCSTEETCRKSKTVLLGAKLYQDTLNTKTNQYVTLSYKADSLTSLGVGVNMYIYKSAKDLSEIKLPLDKLQTQSRFSIKFNEIWKILLFV